MKEATGELNMTVVTVVAIAAIAAFFYAFIWPGIKNTITQSTYCASANCTNGNDNCTYIDEDRESHDGLNCTSYFEKAAKDGE